MLSRATVRLNLCRAGALALAVVAGGCAIGYRVAPAPGLSSGDSAAITAGVRQFAQVVARDVTREGPSAWRRHFADVPSFYMAVDGRLAFADSASATTGIQDVARSINQIELSWGDGMRVDPLAPGLAAFAAPYHEVLSYTTGRRVDASGYFTAVAEYHRDAGGGARWQFRNAHWSSAAAPVPAQ